MARLVFVWLQESITGVVVREPLVLTCIEHWVPLFAAKQMEVNRQLSISISPQGQQPLISKLQCVLDPLFIFHNIKKMNSCLIVSRRDTRGETFSSQSFFFFFLPVTSLAAGIAAGGSGASAVAFGLARVLSGQAAHVLVGVGSPHSADGERKHGTQDTVQLPDVRKWGR